MSSKQTPPHNSVCFYDLATPSPGETRRFYGDVFGWKFMDQGGYEFIHDGSPDGGALLMGGLRQRAAFDAGGVLTYINVASLEATTKKITAAGGQLVSPRIDIPGFGAFVIFEAPGGVRQAAWEGAKK